MGKREKITMTWKRDFFICVWEKNYSIEFTVINFNVYKKCKSPFKKGFKIAELLTKIFFFLYLRDRPKNGGGYNKRSHEKISARVTKHVSNKVAKAEVNLNWLRTTNWL